MHIIFEDNHSAIHIDEIGVDHIVVAVINGKACILGREQYNEGTFVFHVVSGYDTLFASNLTNGNRYKVNKDSIKGAIMEFNYANNRFRVFSAADWKHALQWLIESS